MDLFRLKYDDANDYVDVDDYVNVLDEDVNDEDADDVPSSLNVVVAVADANDVDHHQYH